MNIKYEISEEEAIFTARMFSILLDSDTYIDSPEDIKKMQEFILNVKESKNE